jgi:NitT/TauT family transport system permease protein
MMSTARRVLGVALGLILGVLSVTLMTGDAHFFTGLKIASVGVMAGAITGEFLGGGKGFGELIRVAASQLDTARVFSLIIYLSLLGLATFATVSGVQSRFVFWQKATVRGDGGS